MDIPPLDPAILAGYRDVSVPTVVDRLDLGHGIRSWMRHTIKPLEKRRIAGQAVTAMLASSPGPTGSLDAFFAAIDACGPGRVFVVSNGEDVAVSCMGDLVAAALHVRGAEGAVVDGAVRDIAPILEIGFPVFAASVSPVNWNGKAVVVGSNIPITCGGAAVRPGDVILADWDGVVVIPLELAAEVLEEARAIELKETELRANILRSAGHTRFADLFGDHE
jgi:regulator of RNase E activity RraA